MYTYIKDHIPKNTPYNRRPGHAMDASWITIHNTDNPSSTARNERNWLTNPSNTTTASYHIAIDENEAIECLPLNENGWHAGDGSSGGGNRTSIGIEICESGNYAKTLDNTVALAASMLKERGWSVDRLKRHFDWSGKNCPHKMNEDGKWGGWYLFLDRVKAALQDEEGGGEGPMEQLDPVDANHIIKFLSAAFNATQVKEARKEFNRLANELRRVSGQPPQ